MRASLNNLLLIFCTLSFTLSCVLNCRYVMAYETLSLDTINDYLAIEEAKFKDVIPGTERSVRWFNGVQQTEHSIIYLHGFSASSKEINPTVELLADEIKANIYYARLTGHGRSEDAMLDGGVEAWLGDTRQAYEVGKIIGKNVILISTSTGGTLATWLISQPFANQVITNIMVSPNYGVNSKIAGIVRWPWGLAFAKLVNGPYYSFEPQNTLHKKYWTERYPMDALPPMFELVDLVDDLDKSIIRIPQMVIFSPHDQVVDTSKIEQTIKQFTNSVLTVERYRNSTDPYQHVLAGDACSPESTTEVVDLMSTYINSVISKQ